MLSTKTANIVTEIMTALTEVQSQYPGSSASLVLHTSGDGAFVIERSLMGLLDKGENRVAVDFDSGHELDALDAFRQKVASRFGSPSST